MSRHLTEADIEAVVELLKSWTGPLTWDALVERCKRVRKIEPARQTLHRAEAIQAAFTAAKERLRNPQSLYTPDDLAAALARIARLEAHALSLETDNARYKEKFVRWQYNAEMRGLRQADLENELPPIDRGQTTRAQ